jgi:hypothetical protein
MARAVTSRVPMIKGKKPNSPRMGCHEVENRRWERAVLARIGFDFMNKMMAIIKAMAFTKIRDSRIDTVAKLSLDLLASTGTLCKLLTFPIFSKTH